MKVEKFKKWCWEIHHKLLSTTAILALLALTLIPYSESHAQSVNEYTPEQLHTIHHVVDLGSFGVSGDQVCQNPKSEGGNFLSVLGKEDILAINKGENSCSRLTEETRAHQLSETNLTYVTLVLTALGISSMTAGCTRGWGFLKSIVKGKAKGLTGGDRIKKIIDGGFDASAILLTISSILVISGSILNWAKYRHIAEMRIQYDLSKNFTRQIESFKQELANIEDARKAVESYQGLLIAGFSIALAATVAAIVELIYGLTARGKIKKEIDGKSYTRRQRVSCKRITPHPTAFRPATTGPSFMVAMGQFFSAFLFGEALSQVNLPTPIATPNLTPNTVGAGGETGESGDEENKEDAAGDLPSAQANSHRDFVKGGLDAQAGVMGALLGTGMVVGGVFSVAMNKARDKVGQKVGAAMELPIGRIVLGTLMSSLVAALAFGHLPHRIKEMKQASETVRSVIKNLEELNRKENSDRINFENSPQQVPYISPELADKVQDLETCTSYKNGVPQLDSQCFCAKKGKSCLEDPPPPNYNGLAYPTGVEAIYGAAGQFTQSITNGGGSPIGRSLSNLANGQNAVRLTKERKKLLDHANQKLSQLGQKRLAPVKSARRLAQKLRSDIKSSLKEQGLQLDQALTASPVGGSPFKSILTQQKDSTPPSTANTSGVPEKAPVAKKSAKVVDDLQLNFLDDVDDGNREDFDLSESGDEGSQSADHLQGEASHADLNSYQDSTRSIKEDSTQLIWDLLRARYLQTAYPAFLDRE